MRLHQEILSRVREFEQMELEYFVHPAKDQDYFNEWVQTRLKW